ncbi:Arc family DNA-binding protein [Falsirhodobacter xinxiangensis]|uniref:Arc family DNA-binding protein n=1 Tax=Falsirhodobacter xinxiangensis TaxID=2530049 RepID=UPI0010AB3333|nr:Arc family DNA-binding protein [Rhodobacter xinxiangensis]
MATVGRGADQYTVRFPDGLRDKIKNAADTNNRSMNAEIVARLEASFDAGIADPADVVRIMKMIADHTEAVKAVSEKIDQLRRDR